MQSRPITIDGNTRYVETIDGISLWDAEPGFFAQLDIQYNNDMPSEKYVLKYREALYLYNRIINDLITQRDEMEAKYKETKNVLEIVRASVKRLFAAAGCGS